MTYSTLIQTISEALGACDGRLWLDLTYPERERYVIRAAIIADRVMTTDGLLHPNVMAEVRGRDAAPTLPVGIPIAALDAAQA